MSLVIIVWLMMWVLIALVLLYHGLKSLVYRLLKRRPWESPVQCR